MSTRLRSRTTPATIQRSLKFKNDTVANPPSLTLSSTSWTRPRSEDALWRTVRQWTPTGGRSTPDARIVMLTMTSLGRWSRLRKMSGLRILEGPQISEPILPNFVFTHFPILTVNL